MSNDEFFIFPDGRMLTKLKPTYNGPTTVGRTYDVYVLTTHPRHDQGEVMVNTEVVYESSLNREFVKQNPRSVTV